MQINFSLTIVNRTPRTVNAARGAIWLTFAALILINHLTAKVDVRAVVGIDQKGTGST